MISVDQKNQNILNRFEVDDRGTGLRVFKATMQGYGMTIIDMNRMSIEQCQKMLVAKYGDRFISVTETTIAN